MLVHERHPIDGILADLGTLVRRVRAKTLVPADYAEITRRIRADLETTGADHDGMIAARLDLIELMEEAETLTSRAFDELTALCRAELMLRRSEPMPVVANFAVLPSGVHGRRIGRFTVIDGDASTIPETTLKGA